MAVTDTQIRDHLQQILASDEFTDDFADKARDFILGLLKRFEGWSSALSFWPRITLVVLALALLAFIAKRVAQTVRRASLPQNDGADGDARPEKARITAAMLLQRARNFAQTGNLRDAARALQQAVLVQMCEAQQVPWHASRADWEWIEMLRPSQRMVAFMRQAQRLAFGSEPTDASYAQAAFEAEALLHDIGRATGSVRESTP